MTDIYNLLLMVKTKNSTSTLILDNIYIVYGRNICHQIKCWCHITHYVTKMSVLEKIHGELFQKCHLIIIYLPSIYLNYII